ncbi:DNA-binding protein [Lachnospiraceae bacterium]|nr:DNA-binding protein [Lachnospiraceae bacterium]
MQNNFSGLSGLGISKKLAYKLCKENFFISKRIGRIIRINKRSFEDWLNSGAQ